jgi:SRSO17 transposase
MGYETKYRPKVENMLSQTPDEAVADFSYWADELNILSHRIAPRFARAEPRRQAEGYLKGLFSPIRRKNGWQLAEIVGDKTPDGIQRLLNTAVWDVAGVRDDLRDYVVEYMGDPEGVIIIDETGFLKKGVKSVGVKRQYSGTAGKVENCQIGVFLSYSSQHGRTLLDRELYLPQEWAEDEEHRREAHVPDTVSFQTKPQLAKTMLKRAFEAGVPAQWVAGDTVYGSDRQLRAWLEAEKQAFVLAAPVNEMLWFDQGAGQFRADAIADTIEAREWQRLSAGEGAKGPRLYDWARKRLTSEKQDPDWEHWLLVRRSITDGERAFYVVFAPAQTSLQTLVSVAGQRWTIEECIEIAKHELGLDEYEVRTWHGWYRHITLVMLAQACLNVVCLKANAEEKKRIRPVAECS